MSLFVVVSARFDATYRSRASKVLASCSMTPCRAILSSSLLPTSLPPFHAQSSTPSRKRQRYISKARCASNRCVRINARLVLMAIERAVHPSSLFSLRHHVPNPVVDGIDRKLRRRVIDLHALSRPRCTRRRDMSKALDESNRRVRLRAKE
ncbi:hypothetical protein SCHPADRAFT_748926 [Schizopora paradoxa]|uniref:Uncharacterized protein n=1 Tax=Schizopora paradoxa TaxID=27342 RepID=A0A0H2RIG3_9AGAM|nr:hypothetical protein SCHPADRAFT_748926 [Schizopora paradoxa]